MDACDDEMEEFGNLNFSFNASMEVEPGAESGSEVFLTPKKLKTASSESETKDKQRNERPSKK